MTKTTFGIHAAGHHLVRGYTQEVIGARLAERLAQPPRSLAAWARRDRAAAALQARIEQIAGCVVNIGDIRPMHAAAAICAGRDPFGEMFPDVVED